MDFVSGIQRRPMKIALTGVEGVGKTTFAANAPKPIFMDLEQGSSNLDVTRFPALATFDDVIGGIGWLYSNEHEFETLVVDSMSVVQRLVFEAVAQREGAQSIEAIPYGKGFGMAAEEIESFIRGLDALVAKGMNVIVICHTVVSRFDDPAGDSFDTYDIALHKRIAPMVKQWADTVLFADHDKTTVEKGDGFNKRTVAKSYGERVMHTQHRASHSAKNRYNLPERMPLDWGAFEKAVEAFYNSANKGTKDAA